MTEYDDSSDIDPNERNKKVKRGFFNSFKRAVRGAHSNPDLYDASSDQVKSTVDHQRRLGLKPDQVTPEDAGLTRSGLEDLEGLTGTDDLNE